MTLGALPVVQDHFGPDYRSVVEMLREKIGGCDAAICLVGRHYGVEPHDRAADQPRRSYTQLEYETAVELGKRVFVFVAAEDCPPDHPADEPEELRGLQLEHVKRVVATDTLWMPFRSMAHLTDQVRVMRFDPRSLAEGVSRQLVVLMRGRAGRRRGRRRTPAAGRRGLGPRGGPAVPGPDPGRAPASGRPAPVGDGQRRMRPTSRRPTPR